MKQITSTFAAGCTIDTHPLSYSADLCFSVDSGSGQDPEVCESGFASQGAGLSWPPNHFGRHGTSIAIG